MAYNITGISTNTTGLLTLTQGVNTGIMGNVLGILFVAVLFSVTFVGFLVRTKQTSKSLVAASFIGFISSMLLLAVDLVPPQTLFIMLVLLGASAVFSIKQS